MRHAPYKPLRHRKYICTKEPEGFSPENPERFHEVGAVHLYQFTPSMMEWLEELAIFMCREEIAEEIVKHLGLPEVAAFSIVPNLNDCRWREVDMLQSEIDAMSFDEKLAHLKRGIRIPSPEEYNDIQELDALIEKIEMIKRRLASIEQ